ncbi:hypothetical protein ABMY26_11790 [Azospirillum sp. HJ39]|uniref:hypothetical protein n=1 Tax=Azospirillum sp. HJ39 TaxID=3159496 RepID=UPI003557583D
MPAATPMDRMPQRSGTYHAGGRDTRSRARGIPDLFILKDQSFTFFPLGNPENSIRQSTMHFAYNKILNANFSIAKYLHHGTMGLFSAISRFSSMTFDERTL